MRQIQARAYTVIFFIIEIQRRNTPIIRLSWLFLLLLKYTLLLHSKWPGSTTKESEEMNTDGVETRGDGEKANLLLSGAMKARLR